MTGRKPRTLLDFGIGASVAVVPILLVVLLIVAWWRPLDPASATLRSVDRHISVRQVAALKTFERAIVRRDRIASPLPTARALLDAVPACRAEWDRPGGTMSKLRRLVAGASSPGVSQAERIAARLADLDQALVRFGSGANRRVSDAVGFDAARWFAAVAAALREPVESPEYPGRRFVVQCSDIVTAVAMLTRAEGRMLDALAWRGTEVPQVIARWRPDQFVEISPRQVARANPWSGIPGCTYFGNAASAGAYVPAYFVTSSHGVTERVCLQPEMRGGAADPAPVGIVGDATPDLPADDPRWSVPPSLSAMLQPLDTLHRPGGALYRFYTTSATQAGDPATSHFGPNRVTLSGTPVDVGFSIDVTIDPGVQALAQKAVACYTGRQDVCRAMGLRRKEDDGKPFGHRMLESAVVRMAAVAVIDVPSGRIEALAGALSPCTRQEYDGPGRDSRCDKRLQYPIRYRPDALLNPAVFHDAMPGSVIKPIMATAFLADSEVGARWLASERAQKQRAAWPAHDSLRGELMRSDSARFLDRMFCADKGFANCQRPWNVQAAAALFGWNDGCTQPREDCGRRDLLFGRSVSPDGDGGAPVSAVVPYGRLLVEPLAGDAASAFHSRAPVAVDIGKLRACAAGGDARRFTRDDWEKCRGGIVVDLVAEGWGQGNARATALGVAGMMSTLAAAANGEPVHGPHLVASVRGVAVANDSRVESSVLRWSLSTSEPNRVPHDAAELILDALSYSHRGGTARAACEQLFEPRTCRDFDWIAGKTGTPTFPNDDLSLDDLARLCAPGAPRTRAIIASCGALRPYKWYVAAYRADRDDPRWTKVIGVLTERNWLADTGRIHGAGDRGPNPAAEIAFQIAARHAGYLGERR